MRILASLATFAAAALLAGCGTIKVIPKEDNSQALRDEMRDYIKLQVDAGFLKEKEIVESAVSAFEDEASPTSLRTHAERITREQLADHARRQASWPKTTDCDRLDAAFKELESRGIVARQNFSCCDTCGGGEIWDILTDLRKKNPKFRGYTYYHEQGTESAVESDGVFLAYGSIEETDVAAVAIGHEVAKVIRKHGLKVDWNGRIERKILIELDWKRRR